MTYQPNQKIPRIRSKPHMAYVASLPCIVCGWHEVQVHHLTCGREAKARGLKASDSATLPTCAPCHTALHARGDERAFWHALGIDPIAAAERLWAESQAARAGREMP
jgi:hypothetical protein